MLEIGVHDDHGITVREIEPGCNSHLMPEVAREADRLEAGVLRVELDHGRVATVTASVVHQNHLGQLI
jgi:hypothetical protein